MVKHGATPRTFGWEYTTDYLDDNGHRVKGQFYSKKQEWEPVVRWYKNLWFLNEELVKYLRQDRKTDTVFLWVYDRQLEIQVPLQQFKRYRLYALTSLECSYVLKIGRNTFTDYNKRLREAGIIGYPKSISKNGVHRRNRHPFLYNEADLYKMRDYMAENQHYGMPGKSGRVVNGIPSEQEIKAMIGRGMMLYTEDQQGNKIPVWRETV